MLSLTLALLMALPGPAPGEGFTVVAHPETQFSSVTRGELSKIFLGRLRTWSDGTPAVPIDQAPERAVRQRFSRAVLGRSVVMVEVYWKRMIFSGRGVPPDEVENDRRVLEFVRQRPGAVGYIDAATQPAGVRTLALED